MLVIRKDQMIAINRPRLDRFASDLGASLACRFPDRFPESDGSRVKDFVKRAIDVALQHGINLEGSVARFVQLRAAYGESFEWTPVAAQALAVLHDAALPGPIKVATLEHCLHGAAGDRPITFVPDRET